MTLSITSSALHRIVLAALAAGVLSFPVAPAVDKLVTDAAYAENDKEKKPKKIKKP